MSPPPSNDIFPCTTEPDGIITPHTFVYNDDVDWFPILVQTDDDVKYIIDKTIEGALKLS